MDIARIVLRPRHRKDMGDLSSLAASMARHGLLHPVGIDAESVLIFGARRLLAARDLGWETIPARVIDVDALEAERDENECRKDFTPSERVAVMRAVEERIGDRQGQRTDKRPVQEIAQVQPGEKTRDHATKVAGFGNRETARQAAKVVDEGAPETVEAMDDETLSVSAAADVAALPPEDQSAVVAAVRGGAKPKEAISAVKPPPAHPHSRRLYRPYR